MIKFEKKRIIKQIEQITDFRQGLSNIFINLRRRNIYFILIRSNRTHIIEYSIIIHYRNTMCEVVLEDPSKIKFLTIFQSAEDRLQTNFKNILKRLDHHESLINQHHKKMLEMQYESKNMYEKVENSVLQSKLQTLEKMGKLDEEVIQLSHKDTEILEFCNQINNKTENTSQKLSILYDKYNNHIVHKLSQLDLVNRQLLNLTTESKGLQLKLKQKQNRSEVELVRRNIEQMHKVINKMSQNIKYIDFRLENVDVTFQKNENSKIKQMERITEMEENIKKEIRNSTQIGQIELQKIESEARVEIVQRRNHKNERNQMNESSVFRPAFARQKENSLELKPHQERLLQILDDKVNKIQRKIEESLTKSEHQPANSSTSKLRELKSCQTLSQLNEKLNAIRPELIKIWGRIDAMEQRGVYTDKKIEDKNKQIAYIMDQLKQSNFTKIDDRIKAHQTQFFAIIKQIKVKLDSKASNIDFQKQLKTVTEKCQSLSELILLKSDKIEVKKALLFLQSKIKEIILVISEDEENDRDALITKKQLKCICCDKQVERVMGTTSSNKQNWNSLPQKDLIPENLGRFGMTSFGTMNKKIKRIDSKDLPVISKKNYYKRNSSQHIQTINENL